MPLFLRFVLILAGCTIWTSWCAPPREMRRHRREQALFLCTKTCISGHVVLGTDGGVGTNDFGIPSSLTLARVATETCFAVSENVVLLPPTLHGHGSRLHTKRQNQKTFEKNI